MGLSVCFFLVFLGLFHGFLVFFPACRSSTSGFFCSSFCFFLPLCLRFITLLTAWRACKGSLTASSLGIGSSIHFCPISSMTTKSVYFFLLSENAVSPHCEEKFFPLFGSLYWSCTWRQHFFFDLDRPVIDLRWKVSHGSFTRPRGLPVSAMLSLLLVFVLLLSSLFNICFSTVLWQSGSYLGSLYYVLRFSPLSFHLGSSDAFWFLGG